jgi:hypothetical protein
MSPKCSSSSIAQTWVVRLFASALVGSGAFFGVNLLAANLWHTQIAPAYSALIALVAAGVMLKAIWNATSVCEEFLDINPAIAPAFKDGGSKSSCASGQCRKDTAKGPGGSAGGKVVNTSNDKPAGSARNTATSAAPAPITIPADGVITKTNKVTVVAAKEGDGSITVKITTTGLSNSQLKGNNGLFMRVNGVRGVRWSAHKNVGGNKQVQGTIAAGSSETAKIFASLTTLAERYK